MFITKSRKYAEKNMRYAQNCLNWNICAICGIA